MFKFKWYFIYCINYFITSFNFCYYFYLCFQFFLLFPEYKEGAVFKWALHKIFKLTPVYVSACFLLTSLLTRFYRFYLLLHNFSTWLALGKAPKRNCLPATPLNYTIIHYSSEFTLVLGLWNRFWHFVFLVASVMNFRECEWRAARKAQFPEPDKYISAECRESVPWNKEEPYQ